jgi:hypothetical protein
MSEAEAETPAAVRLHYRRRKPKGKGSTDPGGGPLCLMWTHETATPPGHRLVKNWSEMYERDGGGYSPEACKECIVKRSAKSVTSTTTVAATVDAVEKAKEEYRPVAAAILDDFLFRRKRPPLSVVPNGEKYRDATVDAGVEILDKYGLLADEGLGPEVIFVIAGYMLFSSMKTIPLVHDEAELRKSHGLEPLPEQPADPGETEGAEA